MLASHFAAVERSTKYLKTRLYVDLQKTTYKHFLETYFDQLLVSERPRLARLFTCPAFRVFCGLKGGCHFSASSDGSASDEEHKNDLD